MYEVHSIQQQGRPYGAVVASAILLVGCLGLAAGLVASRGLGGEIRPEGWGIAFRPPTKWEQAQLEADSPRTSLYFYCPGPADQKRELYFVRRANPRRLRANQICGFEASRFFGIAGRLEVAFARQSIRTADFGPLPGANLILPGGYLHVGVMQRQGRPAEAYVMVYTSPVPMDQSDVALIGALIRSVRSVD